jgi:hypothetical protein
VETQHQLRYRKRVPVQFEDGDGHHLGMVLNVSRGGLFVSSRVTPRVGTRVVLKFHGRDGSVASGIPARVVWKRIVHRSANVLADGGIGLEIEGAREVYEQFIRGLVPGLAASSEAEAELEARDEAKVDAKDGAASPDGSSSRYRVRASMAGTPRTRTLEIDAASEQQARVLALDALGDAWQILQVAPTATAARADDDPC